MNKAVIITLAIMLILSAVNVFSQDKKPIYSIPIKGVIDLGLSGFVKRAVLEAKENQAEVIILDIDTFGGRVDAAVEIVDALEKVRPVKTVAFIDDQAWSAGALIALACETIIMSPGSSIGSAEPRAMGFAAGKEEITDEKVVSAIRAKFKAVADENNHSNNLAVAMVDKDIEIKQVSIKGELKIITTEELEELRKQYRERDIKIIKTVSKKGKLLNLTAEEAKQLGLTEAILNNQDEVLSFLNISPEDIYRAKTTWSEALVRFLTHPMISPLFLSLGFLGLLFELRMPGWGISGTLGILFLAIFFWGHYLVGLASLTEILIFFIGIILLALEVFVIPGFGIAGILGIIGIITGLFLALVKHPFEIPQVELNRAFYTLTYAMLGIIVVGLFSLKFLPKADFWKNIILTKGETKKDGFGITLSEKVHPGMKGKTLTILRPAGRAIFNIAGLDKIADVVSEGDFIDKDKDVEILKIEGNRILVKEIGHA